MWYTDQSLNLLAHNITVPGFSPIFPNAHCSQDYSVCQLTTGEGGAFNCTSSVLVTADTYCSHQCRGHSD